MKLKPRPGGGKPLERSAATLALLDPQRILLDGLVSMIKGSREFRVSGAFTRLRDLRKLLATHSVDLLIMEVQVRGSDGIALIEEWTQEYPEMRIFVLSNLSDRLFAGRVLQAGASGFFMKDINGRELLSGLKAVLAGNIHVSERINRMLIAQATNRFDSESIEMGAAYPLCTRELQVLQMVGEGMTNAQIAEALGISRKTVNTHKERIKMKLNLKNAAELAQAAVRLVDAQPRCD